MYCVHLEKFEGPLDLLCQLIEAKRMDITEVSLARVADQFMEHIGKVAVDLATLADFIVVAGRLALIKSRALLPFLELTPEEEENIGDLAAQLAEYREYRELAKEMHRLDKNRRRFYARAYLANQEPVFYFPKKLTAEGLKESAANLIDTITLPQRIPQARVSDSVSLEQKLAEVETRLKQKQETNFSELPDPPTPQEKVAVFLCVLELLRRKKAEARQRKNFEEIKLTWPSQKI